MHLTIWHIIGRNVLHNVICEISGSRLPIFDLNTALLINTAKNHISSRQRSASVASLIESSCLSGETRSQKETDMASSQGVHLHL